MFSLVAAHDTARESEDGLGAIYGVITHRWAAHQLTEVCCSVRSTQRQCQHYNAVDNMLPSCLVCMIEMQSGPPPPLSVRWQDLFGRQASPGFWPAMEAEFPVYFQRCMLILGDWGDCVSLKACPLPLPKCEMLQLGDAGLLLFVSASLSQFKNPGQKVGAACRGREEMF